MSRGPVPSKEQVRAYMASRVLAGRPPPAPADIRLQLGWGITETDPSAGMTPRRTQRRI